MNKKCILFIHGLGSNEEGTWGALKNILNKKKNSIEFSDIDFEYFNYESDKIATPYYIARNILEYLLNTEDSTKKLSSQVDKIAQNSRFELSLDKFSRYKSISIVAHSMGGLISAKYFLNELDQNRKQRVNSILHICTPFVGSVFANAAAKTPVNSPEVTEITTGSKLIKEIISRYPEIEASVQATYLFGDRDEIIKECNQLFNYDSQWIIKGDHSSVLDSDNLRNNYEYIENFILRKKYPNFLENLYERAKNNDHLTFREEYIRKIDSPSAGNNIQRNPIDSFALSTIKDKKIFETLIWQISDLNFNPHEPYGGEKYYVDIETNKSYLDKYWSNLLSKNELNPQFYIGSRGSGKTIALNFWLNKHFNEMEQNNVFHVRCDVHKIYHVLEKIIKHDKDRKLTIEKYLDMQFLYVFLKYRDSKYNNKGEHKRGSESQLIKKLYNDIDKSNKKVVQGSKFVDLGQFLDEQSTNLKHNEAHLRPDNRKYSYAIELMENIITDDEIEVLLSEVNDSFMEDIVINNRLPDAFNKFLGLFDDKRKIEYKEKIIKTIKDNKDSTEKILISDLKTTLYKIEEEIKTTKKRTTDLWLIVSQYIQRVALSKGYKILRIIDGIDSIVIQDSTEDKKFFNDKIDELNTIRKATNKRNCFYFISLRDDSFFELESKKGYFSRAVSNSDIGIHVQYHENAGNSMMKITAKRIEALDLTDYYLNNKYPLYGYIVSYIFNKYEHHYFSERNRFRNIRSTLRHCVFLSLHTFFEFNRTKEEQFDENKCKVILDKVFEEVFFLRSKLYVRTEEISGNEPDYKYKVFPNIFYPHHRNNQWTGLCRLRIIQLLSNSILSKDEIIAKLGCLYPLEYLEDKIENLLNYNLIETNFDYKTNTITYRSTYKTSYLLNIVKSNLNVIYFLCLDTPLPDKYVNEDDAFSPDSYLSIYLRKIDVSENTGYGNSIVKSVTSFILFIKYIHDLELRKLETKYSSTDELEKFSFPLNLEEIEKKMIGVFKGTIANKEIIKSFFMKVGKYKEHELVHDLMKFGWL